MNIIYLTSSLTLIILLLSFFGLGFSFSIYINELHSLIFLKTFLEKKSNYIDMLLNFILKCYYVFLSKWFFDKFYNIIIVFIINFMYNVFMILDKGFFEFLGPYGISKASLKFSLNLISSNQGYLLKYLILLYYGVFSFFFFLFILILL